MPIRAERIALYPSDWSEISARIRRREDNRCKWCNVHNYAWGYREDDGLFVECGREGFPRDYGEPPFWFGPRRIIKIVLTVAHLDHNETNCSDANLVALCQRCHLRYDAAHHQRNAAETRRRAMLTDDLFPSSVPQRLTGSTYRAWIQSLAALGSISAVRVKLADNEDNTSPERVASIPEGESMLRKRYLPARAMLEGRHAIPMTARRAPIAELPDWPRMLSRDEAR